MKKILLALLALLVFPVYGFAFDYIVDDFTNYAIPSLAKPTKGVPFNDPLFGVEIVRITDVQTMFGSGDHWIQAGYSKHDSENADGTYLLLQTAANPTCTSGWLILNALPTSVTFKGNTVAGYGLLQAVPQADVGQGVSIYPRWSTSDPDVFYFERHGQLKKYSVSANTSTLVHQFRYIVGTATGGSTTKLIDTTKNFGTLTTQVVLGAKVLNITDSGETQSTGVLSVTTTTNPYDTLNFSTLTNGASFGAGDSYQIGEIIDGHAVTGISEIDEGTPSDDDRYWGFQWYCADPVQSGNACGILVYDKDYYSEDVGKIISSRYYINKVGTAACYADETTCPHGDSGMTPDGQWVIFGNTQAYLSRDFTIPRNGSNASGHSDLGISAEGYQVELGFSTCPSGARPTVPSGSYYCASMFNIETGAFTKFPTWLGGLSYYRNYHFSGNNVLKPGWGTVAICPPSTGLGNTWNDAEIDVLELTTRTSPPPHVWRITKTQSPSPAQYQDVSFGKFNRSGTKIFFNSPWGISWKDASGNGYIDVYQVNLPATWWEDLGGTIPDAPAAPTLNLPADEAIDIVIPPTVSWNASTGATNYTILVDNNSDFSSPIFTYLTTGTSISVTGLSDATIYYWKVKASNLGGSSAYSAARHFTTYAPIVIPDVPTLTSPTDEQVDVDLLPVEQGESLYAVLTWGVSARATSYTVEVATDVGFANIVFGPTVCTDTTINADSLLYETTYYWKVKATNAGGDSSYSSPWSFTTEDTPAVPILISDIPQIGHPNLFITTYSFTQDEKISIGPNYNFIITRDWMDHDVITMKEINPFMKSLFYRGILTYQDPTDSYYVLDTVTGKKVIDAAYGWYLHDISSAGYRSALAAYVTYAFAYYDAEGNYPFKIFDGIFLDEVLSDLTAANYYQEGTTDPPTLLADLVTNWRTYMVQTLTAIKVAAGSKLVIANQNWARTDYLAPIDGMMDENFCHAPEDIAATYLDTASWVNHLNYMDITTAQSKYYLAQSGVLYGATAAEVDHLEKYCYASFLMGVRAGDSYSKHYFLPLAAYADYWWSDYWNNNLSQPSADRAQIGGKSSYKRVFTNGIVIVNPTDSGETVSLGGTYRDINGNLVSSYTIGAREGVIFFTSTIPQMGVGGTGKGGVGAAMKLQ